MINSTTKVVGYLPVNLDLAKLKTICLNENWNCYQPKEELILIFFKLIINRSIYRNEAVFTNNVLDFTEIHSDFLRKLFGEKQASRYKQLMLKHSLIHISSYDVTKNKSCGFRINPELFNLKLFENSELYHHVEITDKKCKNASIRLDKLKRERNCKNFTPRINDLISMLDSLKIDLTSERAKAIIKKFGLGKSYKEGSDYTYLKYLEAVNDRSIEFFHIDDFGNRMHSQWQSLKKELRPLLYFEEAPDVRLIMNDIVNSQPWLSSCLCPEIIQKYLPEASPISDILTLPFSTDNVLNIELIESYKEYKQLCCDGRIYEEWQKALEFYLCPKWQNVISKLDKKDKRKRKEAIDIATLTKRDAAKVLFYRVIFGNQGGYCLIDKVFKLRFPSAYILFKRIKKVKLVDNPSEKGPFTNLSFLMQRLESKIVLFYIADKLKQNGIKKFVTVHDAVIVPEYQKELAKNVMIDAISEMGLSVPRFKMDEERETLYTQKTDVKNENKLTSHGYVIHSYTTFQKKSKFFSTLETAEKHDQKLDVVLCYNFGKLLCIYYKGKVVFDYTNELINSTEPKKAKRKRKQRYYVKLPKFGIYVSKKLKLIPESRYNVRTKEWSFPIERISLVHNIIGSEQMEEHVTTRII